MASVTLVTGASAGIGAALAREFARRGHRLVLVARREDRLVELAAEITKLGSEALALRGDVSVDGDLERVVKLTLERFGRLDVVVANAGIGTGDGPIEKTSIDDYRNVMETNFFGVLRTAYATLPALKASRGRFAAIGSVSGYLSMPRLSVYAASKYAVRALCEAWVHELRPSGVSVTHVAPGFVESEIRRTDRSGKPVDDPVPAWLVMRTEVAAKQIVDAIDARSPEIVITGHGKAAVLIARHTPWIFDAALRLGSLASLGKKRA